MTNSYKRPRGPDDRDDISLFSPSHTALASRQASMYVSERSAATTAKSVAGLKKETRRKPGARNCMQITRKFTAGVIEQDHFNVLMASPFLHLLSSLVCAILCKLSHMHAFFLGLLQKGQSRPLDPHEGAYGRTFSLSRISTGRLRSSCKGEGRVGRESSCCKTQCL